MVTKDKGVASSSGLGFLDFGCPQKRVTGDITLDTKRGRYKRGESASQILFQLSRPFTPFHLSLRANARETNVELDGCMRVPVVPRPMWSYSQN